MHSYLVGSVGLAGKDTDAGAEPATQHARAEAARIACTDGGCSTLALEGARIVMDADVVGDTMSLTVTICSSTASGSTGPLQLL
mmetsp:Transcript_59760/g.134279  ORF Transcript_59760/g.134279 Transcript_59760/m.134279 type:complete len:84 (+) Transcript_59760:176-427(+)